MRYFWWAEFQKRGALHYHAILVDPPFRLIKEAQQWFDKHWRAQLPAGVFRIQCGVEFRTAEWFAKSGGSYILKDVRKLAGKTYEQDYTRMPRGWRTFRSHQLAFTAAEHQEHESKAHTVCIARPDAPFHERQRNVWIERVDHHVPAKCGCKLFRRKSRRGRARPLDTTPLDIAAAVGPGGSYQVGASGGYRWEKSLERDERVTGQFGPRLAGSELGGSRPTAGVLPDSRATTGCVDQAFQRSLEQTASALKSPWQDIRKAVRDMTTSRARR